MNLNFAPKLLNLTIVLYTLLVPSVFANCEYCETESLVSPQMLLTIPRDKTTVGVVPYYIHNKQVYILLAREKGKFADLGGNVILDGSSFAQNAVRELKQQSMGQISISTKELIQHSKVLYEKDPLGREMFYILYPFSQQDYLISKKFNQFRTETRTQSLPRAYLAKDQYVWFKMADILSKSATAQDIDGNQHTVQLRESFVHDFVDNPQLAELKM